MFKVVKVPRKVKKEKKVKTSNSVGVKKYKKRDESSTLKDESSTLKRCMENLKYHYKR